MNRELFSDSILEMLERAKQSLRRRILDEDKEYLLNVVEEEYLDFITQDYDYGQLTIAEDSLRIAGTSEKVSQQTDNFFGETYEVRQQSIKLEIDFTGDSRLLCIQPGNGLVWTMNAIVTGNTIRFTVDDWNNNPAQLKQDINAERSNLITQVGNVNREAAGFRSQLKQYAAIQLTARKEELNKFSQALVDLGIPITKNDDIPKTFAIPTENIARKIEVSDAARTKAATSKPSLPDPTLATSIYEDILETVHGVGKVIERLPNIYKDRDENSLRDLLLLYLEPRYTSAAGEAFNSKGKTDILIRYENSNAFIAELKFWEGQKHFNETIDQLFGYLTWRDSKTALVIFCKNKDFSSVLGEVKQLLEKHERLVDSVTIQDDSWLKCKLRFPDDSTKEVFLSVLLFHLK
jgi:hypothetical protein